MPLASGVDIERARCQMIDMRPLEGHHIGDQAMGIMQAVVHVFRDIGLIMPAEGFQHLLHEAVGIRLIEPTALFGRFHQRNGLIREDLTLVQDSLGFGPQRLIGDEVQPQQRGENAEGIDGQRVLANGPERGGMNRYASLRKVVIADREYAHDCKHAAHHRELGRRAQADRAVTLF